MKFELDDLDWAMGELMHLFSRANLVGILPHELDPELFYDAWTVLCHQKFEVAVQCRWTLVSMLAHPLRSKTKLPSAKRYENPLAVRSR